MFSDPVRTSCAQIAMALAEEGQNREACEVIRKCVDGIPAAQIPPDDAWIEMINAAYTAENIPLAESLSRTAFDHFFNNARWLRSMAPRIPGEYSEMHDDLLSLLQFAEDNGNTAMADEYRAKMLTIDVKEAPRTIEENPEDSLPPADSMNDSADNR
jgi:hypothetical protein